VLIAACAHDGADSPPQQAQLPKDLAIASDGGRTALGDGIAGEENRDWKIGANVIANPRAGHRRLVAGG